METNNNNATIEYRTLRGLPKKYNNWYIVSSTGDVFSRFGDKIIRMKGSMCKGYRYLTFIRRSKKGAYISAYTSPVHRLIAQTFLGKCQRGMEVHHIDNNKLNNHISNLKYVSRESNMIRGWCDGRFSKVANALKEKRKKQDGKKSILTDNDVRQIRRLRQVLTNAQVGYIFDLHPMQISRIVSRRSFADVE